MKLRVQKTLVTACLFGAGAMARADDAALQRLAACPMGAQLKVVAVAARASAEDWREVATPSGTARVSVASGYRLMLAVPGHAPFVNLKLERSAPGKFDDDLRTIAAHMEGTARRPLTLHENNGIKAIVAENASIEREPIIAMASMFHAPSRVIATAYLLNAKPEQRAFRDQQQYAALRQEFLQGLAHCLRQQ